MLCLGLDPYSADQEVLKQVRDVWPADGAPAWKRDEDVVFLRLVEEDDAVNRPLDTVYRQEGDGLVKTSSRIRVWRLDIVAYGPNSYDRLALIRKRLLDQDVAAFLKAAGMHIVPDMPAPRRVPEIFNANWWERADMAVRFNERVVFDPEAAPTFERVHVALKGQRPGGQSGKNSSRPESQVPERENPERVIARSDDIAIDIVEP
jgi:hypothetical protein